MNGEPIRFPEKLGPLLTIGQWRYKIVHGGRGSAKSWTAARALLLLGISRKLRILCCREVQKTLTESVYQLLKDQIDALGIGGFYQVSTGREATTITGPNGTVFMFHGLNDLKADDLKSFEAVDIVWIEEGQTLTRKSFVSLDPTIRRDNSEIWITLNPLLDTDFVWTEFIEPAMTGAGDEKALVIQMNYRDNPWFPPVLEDLRLRNKAKMKADEYNHVWLGRCRAAVEGAIYADELAEMVSGRRITNVPYDYNLRVHVILDLGWNDSMFAILAQRHLSELRIIEALEDDHKTLSWWNGELRQRRYNWGHLWLPHDGAHGDFKTGKSTKQIMSAMGWSVQMVPNVPVETGLKRGRQTLENAYIDRQKCKPLIEALRRYRRNINQKHGEPGEPVHDASSHGADCWRYTSLVAEKMTNFAERAPIPRSRIASYDVDDEMGM